jgi:hypothetical protein
MTTMAYTQTQKYRYRKQEREAKESMQRDHALIEKQQDFYSRFGDEGHQTSVSDLQGGIQRGRHFKCHQLL